MKPDHGRFITGLLCGGILIAIVWGTSAWWNGHPNLSPQDAALYDRCLVGQGGNTVACDALMRVLKNKY
jgi:hypothetical protein